MQCKVVINPLLSLDLMYLHVLFNHYVMYSMYQYYINAITNYIVYNDIARYMY